MSNVSDDANYAESLDDDKLPAEYPPDAPLGVDEYGVTAAEDEIDEPLEERVAWEEPEVGSELRDDGRVGHLLAPDQGIGADDESDAVATEVPGDDWLDVDDIAGGDPTTRDVATERYEDMSAEEAAVHLTDDPPLGDGDGYLEDE